MSASTTIIQEAAISQSDPLPKAVEESKTLLEKIDPQYRITSQQVLNKKKKKVSIKILLRDLNVIGLNPATNQLRNFIFEERMPVLTANRPVQKPPQVIGQKDGCVLIWRGGSRWGFNRDLSLTCGEEKIIVTGLKFAYPQSGAVTKIIKESYIPYSPEIHSEGIVKLGKEHLEKTIGQAKVELLQAGVRSRAFPEKPITEIAHPNFIKSLILNEHMDHAEFLKAMREQTLPKLIEKIWVIIGLNKEKAMKLSVSKAGACCLTQFMPKTYKLIAKRYPEAGLDKNIITGRQDHVNAVKASIVLFDSDIAAGWKAKTKDICGSSQDDLEKCLAASYNGGPGRLNKVVKKAGINWDNSKPTRILSGLKRETMVYLQKLANIKDFLKTKKD